MASATGALCLSRRAASAAASIAAATTTTTTSSSAAAGISTPSASSIRSPASPSSALLSAAAGPSRPRTLARGTRAFSTNQRCAAQPDFYKVLGVPRNASQTDIKRQFYQLSKKYHPDVNRDDDDAKRKFQEVSEAYATLGHDRSRRAYDANQYSGSSSSSAAGYGHYSTTGGASSMNAERRARAAYAWDYTRRRGESPRSSRASSASSPTSGARPGFASYGRGGVNPESSFGVNDEHPADRLERLAERERRRRERAGFGEWDRSSGGGGAGAQGQGQPHESQVGTAVFRFFQGAGIFCVVLWAGTIGMRIIGLGGRGPEERSRRINRVGGGAS
ncbi:hypothetical protein OC842_005993 [Tilletia horrida]|uniref:J domain-containing protein n=1 Tax=Tilletia horrida TaxID=155126 RepID=A0AAN6G846_9BASI|nr:hypothetical protein OC842_005993 [Tilletia horrida]